MNNQISLSSLEDELSQVRTKKKEFPEQIERIVPWNEWAAICEKGFRNSPLTSEQKMNNRRKSRIRCRIEHIFGFMTGAMHGITIRSIGITRAWMNIEITNLVYNFCRYSYLKRTSA